MKEKVTFGSKIGLIAATVGSAVGLGNVWRFPAETQANGGAAFLLIYIICVFLLGIPVMLGEFALGRGGKSSAMGVYRRLTPGKPWWMAGAVATLASYLILCFYMVVAGWTLEYLFESLTGSLYDVSTASEQAMNHDFSLKMKQYIGGAWLPLIFTLAVILLNLVTLLRGVKKGIERMSNIMMPLLFILLLIFTGVSLTLDKATEGLEFFLNPDFSKITPGVVINAMGQAFFSLSLGMGILITYSAYYPKDTKLGRTAITVSLLDLLVAIMMGLIIFPAVTTFGLTGDNLEGATLVFVTLPEIFMHMPCPQLWSALFFLLLFIAAISSTLSIAEVTVMFCQEHMKVSRKKACCIVLLPLILFSSVCSLSQGPWSGFTILGMNIFDLLDTVTTNIMLPLGSIFMCVYLGWVLKPEFLRSELTNKGSIKSRMLPAVAFIIKWVAPALIAIIMIAQFL
ncbi:MAG: sodium-dependent transporter [Muribaculaceae bacterium]|nr:sodium-dependent transporter [Muribaculaceae bacterium]